MTDESSPGRHPKTGAAWIRIASIGRVPIYVDLTLPLLLALLATFEVGGHEPIAIVLSMLALVLFVAWHEVGHAWMARRLGRRVGGIYLHLFPATWLDAGEPAEEARIALAGPLASLLLGLVLFLLHGLLQGFGGLGTLDLWFQRPLLLAAGVNLAMGVLNLLPVLPADGGRVVRALLALRVGMPKASLVVGVLGLVVGLALAAFIVWRALAPDAIVSRWLALAPLYIAWVSARELASR